MLIRQLRRGAGSGIKAYRACNKITMVVLITRLLVLITVDHIISKEFY